MEELQPVPVAAAKDGGLLRAAIVKTVIVVGTTVAPESVAHPTDSRVLEHSRQHLVKAAAEHGLKLRVRAACARGRVVHQQGKARTPYEFGVKVSIATTLKEGFVVGARAMPGNPYDGHAQPTRWSGRVSLPKARSPRRSWIAATVASRCRAFGSCAQVSDAV